MEWPAHLPIVGGGGVTAKVYLGVDSRSSQLIKQIVSPR